jgi:hypothetical protein
MTLGSPFAVSPLPFFLAFAAAFAVYWWTAVEGRSAFTWRSVAVLGLFARLLLLPMPPGDDMARYLWEGRLVAAGENPYVKAPDDPGLAYLRDSSWQAINHKDMPAVYPPVALGLFAGLSAWEPHPLLFKAAFVALDALALAVLAVLGVTPRIGAVYFLNPLLIFESAGNGHFESLPLLFCVLFLASLRWNSWHAAVWAALAALSKIMGLALLPVLVLRFGWRRGFAYAALSGGAVAGVLTWTGSLGTLARFGGDFHYNDLAPWILCLALGRFLPPAALTLIALMLLAGGGLWLMRRLRGAEAAPQGLAFMGLLLLFSPTVHPWYVLWVLPFAAVSLSRPWLLLTGTAAAAYGAYAAAQVTGKFREIPWLRLPQYLPPAALCLLCRIRRGKGP